MKCRLHHAPLPQPEFAFAGEEAIPEDVPIGAKHAALDEFLGVRDQDVLNQIGVYNKKRSNMEEAQADDVAVFTSDLAHESQRVAANGTAQTVEESLFGTRRIVQHREMIEGRGGKSQEESGKI